MVPTKHQQTYFITGAAGFIGSHLCRALLTQETTTSIIAIDDINDYYHQKIKTRRIKELSRDKRFLFYKTSILDTAKLHVIVSAHKPTTLIHAAAQVGVRNGEAHPFKYFQTNVLGTVNILEAMPPSVSHAVVFSSSSVYGSIRRIPFRESETIHANTPLSMYGASKASMEIAVHAYYKHMNIPITIIRPFSIYGPDGRPDMLPMKLLIAAKNKHPLEIYAATTTSRDWTYIDDCISMILQVAKKPNGIQTINIGNGHPMRLRTIIDISQKIIQRYGYSLRLSSKPANPIELKTTWADTMKIKKILKPLPATQYQEGFQKTADFFFSHPDLYN